MFVRLGDRIFDMSIKLVSKNWIYFQVKQQWPQQRTWMWFKYIDLNAEYIEVIFTQNCGYHWDADAAYTFEILDLVAFFFDYVVHTVNRITHFEAT
jgi:hypothetical protein